MVSVFDNPFRSKAQARLFFAKERRGELPRGTARRWMHETPHYESLPEYVSGYGCGCGIGQATEEVVVPVPVPATANGTAPPTFWQAHGTEIVVGTITAVTGALAVYFAMRAIGKK